MLSKVLALLLLVQTAQVFSDVISVSNGGKWGEWGLWETCPEGSVATGFSLKVQDNKHLHIIKDDTAVDGIRLHCVHCRPPHNETIITSAVAPWGEWTEAQWCDYGRLSKFSARVEPDLGIMRDDTTVNNFKFECTDGKKLEGEGLTWGFYGEWSETCKKGICGVQTKVQGNEERGIIKFPVDNTGLNDVRFMCCP